MAELGGDVPSFDELLDSSQPKDTQVIILEEHDSTAAAEGAGKKRRRHDTEGSNNITLEAHWVVLFSLSPCFRAKVSHSRPVAQQQAPALKLVTTLSTHVLFAVGALESQ
jgi:hypothetical protein